MNYTQTIDFLFSQLPAYHRIGKAAYRNDLGNIIAMDHHLGHPHKGYATIHVGGTNGKGSVSHMIASIMMEAGYRTGLYTSPHLVDFRERIKVNGKMIPRGSVARFVEENSGIINSLKPSFFEMTVAMALDHFEREGVEYAVIEVGLGGRLDSTNIISPLLSVITNIGHDHMDLLGDTLEKIAVEKAGIIKKGVPVVVGETQNGITEIFKVKAAENGSEIYFADQNFNCELADTEYPAGIRRYRVSGRSLREPLTGESPLCGDYQAFNIQTVFQACEVLREKTGFTPAIINAGIRKTVKNTGLSGRWQIAGRNPLVICDTGHNREGLEYVVRQLEKTPGSDTHIVLGFVKDKDLGLVLPLFPRDARYYFTKASVPRALDENVLREQAAKYGLTGSAYPDVSEAIKAARSAVPDSGLIFIGGSTFIVADALKMRK